MLVDGPGSCVGVTTGMLVGWSRQDVIHGSSNVEHCLVVPLQVLAKMQANQSKQQLAYRQCVNTLMHCVTPLNTVRIALEMYPLAVRNEDGWGGMGVKCAPGTRYAVRGRDGWGKDVPPCVGVAVKRPTWRR